MEATKHYSARDAARILQATEARVRNWARLGGVVPRPGQGGRHEFTFQQLLLLRTTRGLLEAGVPARRVRRIWSSLRGQLAEDLPLTSIRILADGDRAIAWDGNAPWQPDSGQFVLDFRAGEIAEKDVLAAPGEAVAPPTSTGTPDRVVDASEDAPPPDRTAGTRSAKPPARSAGPPALTAEQWFHLGCELEGTSPIEARQAYLQAIDADPEFSDAHLNLGRLEHESGGLGAAEAHYRNALRLAPDDATCHYNLAVLLEDMGRPDDAIDAYKRAIAHDPDGADAHYNLGLLLEAQGRRAEAIRHLMTARRLYAPEGAR